jgi:hypothetical protein
MLNLLLDILKNLLYCQIFWKLERNQSELRVEFSYRV